ncbi:MAG: tail fiber domain-containing protein [Saprospiraceae bacterium]|nr:tail fiber domain-containing protein [Saprospiraceae bacterium]
MKMISIFIFIAIGLIANAQNVDNGNSAANAQLEVEGVVGSGATVGLFGSTANGVSLQRNWPTFGFNQYRDNIAPGSQGKYIGNGFAAIQYFDYNSGTYAFDLFPSGTANSFTPIATRGITIANTGNTSIRTNENGATLNIGRGDGIDGTAVFTGPNYWSHFNYNIGEDTYIRAGVAGGTVYVNKTTNSSALMGTTSTHLGINSPNPFYTIEVYQPSGQKAFALVDANNYRWAMAANHINVLDHGHGVALDFYYDNVGRGRFQYFDGNYIVLSDERVKKDIQDFDPVLDKLKKLKPVRYEVLRNNPNHEQTIGLLAQDVRPLFPGLVHQIVDHNRSAKPINDALVMDYSGFGVIAIKALQEQEKQILELQKQKQELLERLKQLEVTLQGQ